MPSDMGRPPVDFSRPIARFEIKVRNGIIALTRRRKRFALFLIVLISIFFYLRSGSTAPGQEPDSTHERLPESLSEHQEEVGIDKYVYFPTSPLSSLHDARYSSLSAPPSTSQDALSDLTRSLLETLPILGITPWPSSTTLLGWHWQRSLLPWPATSPISVHLSLQDLTHMATHYNRTTYVYPSPHRDTETTYLLDISPFYATPLPPSSISTIASSNAVDARYIDTTTGLFIAITAVSLSSSFSAEESSKNSPRKGAKQAKFLGTRDGRAYESKLVYPLQKSHFEGVECWVPGGTAVLLAQEFGKGALTTKISNGYRFDDKAEQWVPLSGKTT